METKILFYSTQKKNEKVPQCRKKLKGGRLWDFSTSIQSQNSEKIEGDPLGIFFRKKSQCRKKMKGGPFSLVRYCMLRGKPFWFSSLGQQVQFGVFLKFCRTFGIPILVTSGISKK